jgi:hypothetical protein
LGQVVLQNNSDRFAKIGDSKLRFLAQGLAVTVIDENSAATGSVRAVDVAPAIANEEAARKVDAVDGLGAQ